MSGDGSDGAAAQLNEWDEHAASWDRDAGPRRYAAAAFAALREVCAQRGLSLSGATVCDFGCGTGLLTEHLVAAGAAVDAADTSVGMLGVLRAKIQQRGWTQVRALGALPDSGASAYDVVVCSSVCSFLPDYPAVATELVRRLRPGGLFIQWDWERADDADPHGLSREEITAALQQAGLSDVTVRPAFRVEVEGITMQPLEGFGWRPSGGAPSW